MSTLCSTLIELASSNPSLCNFNNKFPPDKSKVSPLPTPIPNFVRNSKSVSIFSEPITNVLLFESPYDANIFV